MVVLVTGGAGFIGSELVAQLVQDGKRVRVVDNLVNGREANIAEFLGEGSELVVADVRDSRRMGEALAGVECVFHLACLGVRHSIHSPAENHAVNASATLDLLTLARARGVPRFVHVSSSEVYGSALVAPITEEHPTFPMTVYGASKLAGEAYARAFHRTYAYPTVVVRPFNTFGPRSHHEGDSGEVIPKFLLRSMAGLPLTVFGDGNQTRDFSYVGDIARGILQAGATEAAIGETINLGSGHEVSINDLAARVAAAAGAVPFRIERHPARPGDVRRLCASVAKAERLVGFKSEVRFEDGLARLHDWYQRSGKDPAKLLETERTLNWQR